LENSLVPVYPFIAFSHFHLSTFSNLQIPNFQIFKFSNYSPPASSRPPPKEEATSPQPSLLEDSLVPVYPFIAFSHFHLSTFTPFHIFKSSNSHIFKSSNSQIFKFATRFRPRTKEVQSASR